MNQQGTKIARIGLMDIRRILDVGAAIAESKIDPIRLRVGFAAIRELDIFMDHRDLLLAVRPIMQ